MIEAINLTKVFHDRKRGDVRAVDGMNFRCQPGQIYGLLGANGAGKTTTLRLLATILQPSDGTAQVAGFLYPQAPRKCGRLATVLFPLPPPLWPRLRGVVGRDFCRLHRVALLQSI